MARKYKAGPAVKRGDKVYDSKGNLIDHDYIDRAIEDVHRQLGRGRPSLTAPGAVSPEIKARVPADLKRRVEQVAKRQGKSTSAVVREALERHLEAS